MEAELYKNKYRIKTTRLADWDYSWPGFYYVTICTKNMVEYFGSVVNKKMVLNRMGCIVDGCWEEILKHFDFIELDEFVVMPNHVHGIIRILCTNEDKGINHVCRGVACNASTHERMSLISPKHGSLASIIRSFKSACTKEIRTKFPNKNFQWQSRYYDHIVKNQNDLDRVRNYIKLNPFNWQNEKCCYD